MQKPPPYAIASVDNALQLALWLKARPYMRLRDAAEELGVAQSTAHRLLAMLCYHGFAAQLPDKSYVAGPVLRPVGPLRPTASELSEAIHPHLSSLRAKVGETAQFAVLTGREIIFLAAAEGLAHTLAVRAQTGRRMPAHVTAAGRAILAMLGRKEVIRLYGEPADDRHGGVDLPELLRHLDVVRQRGYATNVGEVDRGINALGVCVRANSGEPLGALTVSAPAHRLPISRSGAIADALRAEAAEVERSLGAGL